MLTTIPSYIVMSSFGFGAAAITGMTQQWAAGDKEGALRIFQSVWALVSLILVAGLVIASTVWFFSADLLKALPAVSLTRDTVDAGMVLVIYSIVLVQGSVIGSAYQSTGRYAQGTLFWDLISPAEAVAILTVALLGGGMCAVALSMSIVRIIGTAAYYHWLQRCEPWLRIGLKHASLNEIKRLANPAVASLSMTLSSALSLQGLTLTLGIFVSPAATAVFATARLLTRVPLQLTALAGRASLPEMTAAHVRNDRPIVAMLALISLSSTAVIVVLNRPGFAGGRLV
jgi:O-antigen/teichoic acid export membrane protein